MSSSGDYYSNLILGSSVIGAFITAIISIVYSYKSTKSQRKAEMLKDEAGIYSFFIYLLATMVKSSDFVITTQDSRITEPVDKISETFRVIDDFIASKFYLVSADIISEYIDLRGKHRDLYRTSPDELRVRVKEVGKRLVGKYNVAIRSEYYKTVGKKIDTIDENIFA